jgi:alkylation response protein AidB-like acyl-CoA dehydrogenase
VAVDAIRSEVRGWLEANWDPELSLIEWRTRLADAGWAVPSWPKDWFGRGLPASADSVVHEEISRIGAVGMAPGAAMSLAGPTILEHGSDELKGRLLRPIITGEHTWCQLFSEPGSGSDLAGLTTKADKDGDEWIVNGQKVWNTSAHHADYGLLLARTNWDVPKHAGITYFALPMKQPGVDVRPLKQMNGRASFNEVFLSDVRVPDANIIGAAGNGWKVAVTTLAHERRLALFAAGRGARKGEGRAVREAEEEAAEYFKTYEWYPQRAGRADLAVPRAKETGTNTDPVIRQEVAGLIALSRSSQWTSQRAQAARGLGRPPGPEGSLGKLNSSNIARAAARVHSDTTGAWGMLTGDDSPHNGVIAEVLVSVPAGSITGGTDEIQHNIIGERVLGLPKEPASDRELPFREVPRNMR